MPCRVHAASTADAKEMISPERSCTLTVSYHYEGTTFAGLPVKLYNIADVSADFQYSLTAPFQSSGLVLNGVRSASEWNVIRSTLEAARRDAAQGMVTAEWVSKYIDKILATPEEDGSLRLDIKIFTGETTQKYLANLARRTGHTFKKMIEAYEQGMQ
jgi:hypothetical protein